MRSKFVRVVVAAGLSVMLAVPMPSLAASDISTSVSDVSVVPVTRDVKIVEKLLAIKPRLLEVVAEGYDSQFAIFDDAGTPAADYFYDQRDAYVEALSAVYDSMEYDDFAMHPDYGDTLSYEWVWAGSGDYYLARIRDVLRSYKSDVTFLRAYAKNPARYDVSDAERLEVENRMVSMQRVFVDAWDEWVSPYITQDYQETGSADVSFTSSLVDVSIAYDSYTSILSFLRGEQSVDLDFDYTLDFKENELLPEELRGKSVSAQGDLTVKSFSEEGGVYVTVRELSIDLGAGFTSTEQDSVRLFEESLRGKTIRLPINTVNGSMPSMFDAVRALDAAIHSLSDVSVLMPVIKNAKGNYLLAVNPEAVNDVSEVIIREMPYISSEDLNSENSSRLTMLPGVVWREVDGKGELYRPFSSAIDGSDGYARLGYDDANESLVFAMRLKEEGHAGNNTLSIDMDRDRYNIQASIAEGFDMTLDWTDAEFDLRASGSDYAGEEWTFSIEGIANLRSHIDLVARYNDERLFSTSYQLIDNRSTYSFDLESEIPAYAFGNLESIPFSFQVSGYYDSSFGTFPIIKPEVYTSVEEWLEQLDSAGGNDGEELLDGLLQ